MTERERDIVSALCVMMDADTDEEVKRIRHDYICAKSKVTKIDLDAIARIVADDVLDMTQRRAESIERMMWEID